MNSLNFKLKQPLTEVNVLWEKKNPHQEVIIFNKTMCATIIGTLFNKIKLFWTKCNWSIFSIYISLLKLIRMFRNFQAVIQFD